MPFIKTLSHLCLVDGPGDGGPLVQALEGPTGGYEGWQLDPASLHHAGAGGTVTLTYLLGCLAHCLQQRHEGEFTDTWEIEHRKGSQGRAGKGIVAAVSWRKVRGKRGRTL